MPTTELIGSMRTDRAIDPAHAPNQRELAIFHGRSVIILYVSHFAAMNSTILLY
jgi:hypothetical protein